MQIAVVGPGTCTPGEAKLAEQVGSLVAAEGATLLCGGLLGVMEAAAKGAHGAGGLVVGILPGTEGGNRFLHVIVRSGLGHARNVVLVQSADAVIAIGGRYGTLSEVAVALKCGIPVYGLNSWEIDGVTCCTSVEEAVARAVRGKYP